MRVCRSRIGGVTLPQEIAAGSRRCVRVSRGAARLPAVRRAHSDRAESGEQRRQQRENGGPRRPPHNRGAEKQTPPHSRATAFDTAPDRDD